MPTNYIINDLPERAKKPREEGLTMVIDKGLSISEVHNLMENCGEYIDYAKLGWGTSYVTTHLQEKINAYKAANVQPYLGGTLFEIMVAKNQLDTYKKIIEDYKLEYIEISNGVVPIPLEEKCKYIEEMKDFGHIFSEIGSKQEDHIIGVDEWVYSAQEELKAGSEKIIGEARESGITGLFRKDGTAKEDLIHGILDKIDREKIIWETPLKGQQTWFITLLGANVNLGNITPSEAVSLESMRLGLRADTFYHFNPSLLP